MKQQLRLLLPLFLLTLLLSLAAAQEQAQASPHIVGGQEAQPGAWPWIAAVVVRHADPFTGQFCGGSLIHARWVLTAAHCVHGKSAASLDVVLGRHRLTDANGERIAAQQIIIHPGYNATTFNNDIALIRLAQPSAQPIVPLLDTPNAFLANPGVQATIAGWGNRNTVGVNYPNALHQVSVPVVSQTACRDSYGLNAITDNMLCAGLDQGGKDACQGDSGGPFVVSDRQGGYVQAGIVSWGSGCAQPKLYGVYTRVTNYTAWVAQFVPISSVTPVDFDEVLFLPFVQR